MTEIDPAAALELLPKKIADTERIIQELLLDISVIEKVPDHNAAQIVQMQKSLTFHKLVKAEYEKRLKRLQEAARGDEPPNRATRRAAKKV